MTRVSIDARYIRERPSGIGAYVRALVDRVPALAPDLEFHVWTHPKAPRPLSARSNVTETVVRAMANGPQTLAWPSRLVDLERVDVLHEPFNILGRGVRCATVVTIHDLMWIDMPLGCEPPSLATPVQVLFYRDGILRALRRATRIVAISRATADSIARCHAPAIGRTVVIPHGVEPSYAPPPDVASSRALAAAVISTDAPYFLVVGQNAPYKNHLAVLEAFAAAGLPRVRLVFVQRLYPRGSLARRSKALGVSDRVVATSGLTGEQVVALMQNALALVQFSRWEGFGMPALEAMACGTPVIASDVAPLVEVTNGAALHVPLETAALASALRRLARDEPMRADLAARGLERAREFSWDRSARDHLEVYRDAASRS